MLTNFGLQSDTALAVAIQRDGKIVAAGGSGEDVHSAVRAAFALARYYATAVSTRSSVRVANY